MVVMVILINGEVVVAAEVGLIVVILITYKFSRNYVTMLLLKIL